MELGGTQPTTPQLLHTNVCMSMCLCVSEIVLLCSSGCLGTHYVDNTGLELTDKYLFCLLRSGIKGTHYHAWSIASFFKRIDAYFLTRSNDKYTHKMTPFTFRERHCYGYTYQILKKIYVLLERNYSTINRLVQYIQLQSTSFCSKDSISILLDKDREKI